MPPEGSDAIVGGGVMALSLARALAQRGRAVSVYSELPWGEGGASAAPVALLNPFRGRTGRASADDRAALATTWRWVAALHAEGRDPGAHQVGVVRVADSARQFRAFASVGGLTPLTSAQLPTPFRSPYGGAIAATGGWIEPARYLAALAESAAGFGARLRVDSRIEALEPSGGQWRLRDQRGEEHEHPRVWICIGASPWPPAWERTLRAPPAIERLAGDIVTTPLAAPSIPLAGGTYVGPNAGRAALGGHHRPPGPPPADARTRLVANLLWAWPELTEAAVAAADAWWGVRAHLPGNRPQAATLAAGVTWLGGLAGRGFLAAAATAEAVADGAT
jgi:glycine/D-amino acid oxidase-like deaminating enzyme